MARIHDDDIRRLKENVSLADLCRSRGIELKKHGSRDFIGKCPFHPDENPSFVVTPSKNLFHCLGCDAAGSVIDFVMKRDGLDFRAAVDKLLGSTPKLKRAADLATEKKIIPPERARQLLERVIAIYAKNFTETPEGRKYLEGRGIADAGLFTQHRIGYSNGRLKEILPTGGEVWNELKALGLILENGQERFTGCVVAPVCDPDGELVTLYGRFTGEGTPSTSLRAGKRHVFLPDRSTGLWNATAMKTYSEIILVESVIDALSVIVAGHRNVIAVQGTNGLSAGGGSACGGNDSKIAMLCEHGVQNVTLLLDGDDAGKKAATRLNEKLSSSFSCRVLTLPDNHDPNSFLTERGATELAAFLNHAAESGPTASTVPARPPCGSGAGGRAGGGDGQTPPTSGGLALTIGIRRYEIRGLEKGPRKLKVTLRIEHAGKLHVDTLDLYSARSRKMLAMDLCRIFDETPETIEGDIAKLMKFCETARPTDEGKPADPAQTLSIRDRQEAEAFGKSPQLFQHILDDFEACGLVGEKSNKLLSYLAMTSRKMDEPLSVLTLSSSGAGKTVLQDTATDFCPPEDLIKLTSLSGKALFYKEQLSLKHKVLALEEGDGAQEASYALRNLISSRELVIEAAIKDPTTGRITTMENRVEGPTTVFITTTDPDTDAETKSRFFVTSIDESREQTRAILFFQRKRQTLDGLADQAKTDAILSKHRNFQRLLKPLAVINPYGDQLRYGDDRLQGRRDQPKYLNLIKAIAFLRQMQPPSPEGSGAPGKQIKTYQDNGQIEYIEADREDIRLANDLAHEILGHSLDELSRPGRDLLMQLDAMVAARLKEKPNEDAGESRRFSIGFTRREIREFTGWANARVHRYLKELADLEYVLVDSGRNGVTCRYRLAWDGQGKDGKRFVLGLKDIADLREPRK